MLCMYKLSHLIHDDVTSKSWRCLQIGTKETNLSHLLFVEYIILFGLSTEHQLQVVLDIIYKLCDAYGQRINVDKTIILFSGNTPILVRKSLTAKFGFKETSYLGKLP